MINDEKVLCPLVDMQISVVECMENRETKEVFIPERFKEKADWKKVCQNCKYYNS